MKNKKIITTLLIIAIMTASSLTGCGNNNSVPEKSSSSLAESTASSEKLSASSDESPATLEKSTESSEKSSSSSETSPASSEEEPPTESGDGFLYQKTGDDIIKIVGLDTNAEDPGDVITVPESIDGRQVTAIGEKAFWGNLDIQTVILPDSITTIEAHAFDDCSNLTSIHLPDNLEEIGEGAFFCCSSLAEIDFPSALTTIGKGAFYNCLSLTEITLPDSLTVMGNYAFYYCKGLISVTLNEGLTEVAPLAFLGCENLTEVTLPSTLKVIGDNAFAGCAILESITFPENMDTIGKSAFEGCSSLNNIVVTAKEVGSRAFSSCGALTDLTLSSGVEALGDDCLGYSSLISLKIPATVSEIGTAIVSGAPIEAFETEEGGSYTAVDGVLFDKDMTTLVEYPSMKAGKNYIVPDGVKAIADQAFAGSQLTSITLPDGLESIGTKAFQDMIITEITIPDTVDTLGEFAFSGCMEMTSVKLSDAITELPHGLFAGAYSLTDITFPASLTTIRDSVFQGCDAYTTFTIPDTVTDLDPNVDMNSSITAFAVSDSNENFSVKDGVLFSKDGKKLLKYPAAKTDTADYTVPEGTESIGSLAFSGTYGLNSVILADSIVTLDEESLVNVAAVRADEALTSIGERALGYTCNPGTLEVSLLNGFVLYGAAGSKAEEYADEQEIAFATGEMKLSDEEMTIQMGETRTLTLENADPDHLYYFSSDENILTVDEKGLITPVANGTTSVVAAIGSKYFVCNVTVEGGEEAAEEGKLPGFTELTNDTYADWLNDYLKENSGNSFDLNDNKNIAQYTGAEYIPIVAVQEGEEYSHYQDAASYPDLTLYGMIGDDLNEELSRFVLQTDTILFSGKNAHEIGNYTGAGATLTDLVNSVGRTFTRKEVISTSVSYKVATGFGDYILEIYAPADVTRGMYCSSISDFEDEYELLLAGDTTYEIIGAGVRAVDPETFDSISESADDMAYPAGAESEAEDFEDTEIYYSVEEESTVVVKPYLQVLIK